MSQTSGTKVCCACRLEKPLGEYHQFARSRDGRQSKCRSCCAEYQRAYNATHGQQRAARRAEQARANEERDRAAKRKWATENPERMHEKKGRRRALERRARVGPVDTAALWTGTCGICAEEIDRSVLWPHPMSKSLDHIVPLAKGGGHVQSNLQWTHLTCNIRKGAKLPAQTVEG